MTYQDYEAARSQFLKLERELKIARRNNLVVCIAHLESEMKLIRTTLKMFTDAIQV